MEPLEMHLYYLYKFLLPLSKVAGTGFLAEDFQPGFHAWAFIFGVSLYVLSSFYTVIVYEMEKKIICLCLLGLPMQGLAKFHMCFKYHPQIRIIVAFTTKVMKANMNEGPNFNILLKIYKNLFVTIKMIILIYTMTAVVFFMMPTLQYMYDQSELVPLLPAYLPGLDGSTKQGYLILAAFHGPNILLAAVGSTAIDTMVIFTIAQVVSLAFLFNNEVDRLNGLLEKGKLKVDEIRHSVRNLVLMHKDYCNYIDSLNKIYNVICTIQVGTTSYSLVVTIYNTLIFQWIQGPFILMIDFALLLSYCALGTLVELMTDKVYNAIASLNYYLLPIPQQRIILIMMARAQRPILINVFGVIPMNMQTFVSIIKSVYSFTMLLMESME